MNLGVYVHIPFCETRCPHCDFVTTDRADLHRRYRTEYVETLRREWALRRARHPDIATARLTSVFFGGGTPNLLAPDEIAPLLRDIRDGVDEATTDGEVTLEMNPGLSDADALRRLRAIGVNRVSLGAQSTHDRLLRALGRRHTARAARQSFDDARAAGFDNINVDLIFGIPGQSHADWKKTLAEVVRWNPEHICAYNLTVKDQTPLAARVRRGEITLPRDEVQCAMFERAHEMLTAAGLEHVEISNFARPGRACRHSGDVWRGESYLGLGLAAHSCLGGQRFWNTDDWEAYHRAIAADALPECPDAERTTAGRLAEDLYLGLRTRDGVDLAALQTRHGADLRATKREKIEALIAEGLAALEGDRLRLTLRGWAVSDAAVAELL